MLPQKRRIPRVLYSKLLKATVFKDDLLMLRVAKYDKSDSRFSVSIAKKVVKKANMRNNLRRMVYRMLAKHILEIKNGSLIQFVFRKEPSNKQEVEAKFAELLNKIKK